MITLYTLLMAEIGLEILNIVPTDYIGQIFKSGFIMESII